MLSRHSFACIGAALALLLIPAVALAVKAPAPPRPGSWLVTGSTGSGGFTISKKEVVTSFKAKVKPQDCESGTLKISGSLPLSLVKNASKVGGAAKTVWAVASGGGTVDPGLVQPTPVSLKINGHGQVNSKIFMTFTSGNARANGYVAWGDDGEGGASCEFDFTAKRG